MAPQERPMCDKVDLTNALGVGVVIEARRIFDMLDTYVFIRG